MKITKYKNKQSIKFDREINSKLKLIIIRDLNLKNVFIMNIDENYPYLYKANYEKVR